MDSLTRPHKPFMVAPDTENWGSSSLG
jgi:hypothetical protein